MAKNMKNNKNKKQKSNTITIPVEHKAPRVFFKKQTHKDKKKHAKKYACRGKNWD